MKNQNQNSRQVLSLCLMALLVFLLPSLSFQVTNAQDVHVIKAKMPAPDPEAEFVPDEFIVKFSSRVSEQIKQAILQRNQFSDVPQIDALNTKYNVESFERVFKLVDFPESNDRLVKEYGLDRTYLLRVLPGTDIKEAVAEYGLLADVVYAEPNYIDHADMVPNDPTYTQQWGLHNTGQAVPVAGGTVGTPGADINAEAAWDLHTGDASIILAILDSGVDYNHPEFSGRTVQGIDTGDDDDDPMDSNGHGTGCAGIAAATGNNGQGVAGVNWNCMIMPVKAGVGAAGTFTHANSADGMVWAALNGADVISCSYGGVHSATKQLGVDIAYGLGSAIIAALGNDNTETTLEVGFYPASYWNVLAVGALSPCNDRKSPTTCDGEDWWGSNYGIFLEIMAPGARLHTTDITGAGGFDAGDYTSTFNGTSGACPFAAGVAALIRSYVPSLTNAQVYDCIRNSAVDINLPDWDSETGYGRLNAFGALNYAASLVNTPPVALCQDLTAHANENCQAYVTPEDVDDGSYDPDGDPITLSLDPEGPYPLGSTTVTLTVSDAYFSETCTATVTVVDVTPPEITCPADVTQNNDPGECGAVVSFSILAEDNCDMDVNIVSVPASGSFFDVGTATVMATATDDYGNQSQCTFDVTVVDSEPPVINTIAEPIVLWPPNHKYVSFDLYDFILSVSDNCSSLDISDVLIVGACSDEPENAIGIGDGNTLDDIVIAGDCKSIDLRMERDGEGDGRVYTVYFELTDEYGNTETVSCGVHVPLDMETAVLNNGMAYEESGDCYQKSYFFPNTIAQAEPDLKAYPNPFSGTTVISFTLASTTSATISVYNLTGALVATIYQGLAEGGQEYKVSFSSESLPEGVYFYNLLTENGISITKKLILTK